MAKFVDLSGKRFGKLVVIKRHEKNKDDTRRGVFWECECDCGNMTTVGAASLPSGNTKSCGCLQKPLGGESNTYTYQSWSGMMNRCYNKKQSSYKNYGARGISVCKEWHNYLNFLSDMGERPKGSTIERINNDLRYSKDNCKWDSRKNQCNNKSNNAIMTLTLTMAEWSELLSINYSVLRSRRSRGMSDKEALLTPLKE